MQLKNGYKLLHKGTLALADVEQNGMKIDEKYLKNAIKKTGKKVKQVEGKLKKTKTYKIWRKTYGNQLNLDSRPQMADILFNKIGYKCPSYTDKGNPQVTKAVLENINLKFVKQWLYIAKLKKASSTYLTNLLRETNNGYIHPFFDLHTARTFRSSSSVPNFQNIPINDPLIAKLVRRCFIPRKNRRIVEVDYSGIEIASAACYHKDPAMLEYLRDDSKDLHRDMAQACYKLPKNEIIAKNKKDDDRISDIRKCGKGKFVFPQFYNDYYIRCAKSLWNAIDEKHLKLRNGVTLKQYLKQQGIKKLGKCNPKKPAKKGTFERHIKSVEDWFWHTKFPKYNEWKENWHKQYLKKGYFTTLTGFKIQGLMSRNQINNYPIQGTAFHFLLWSLIRINKLLKKYKMKTLLTGQIHDSIVADVPDEELVDYLQLVNKVMTKDIKKYWKWIIVPLKVDAEATPLNKSWLGKRKVNVKDGEWADED